MCVLGTNIDDGMLAQMKWKNVRLELAANVDFPRGSAGRAYQIRLPLDENGQIDTCGLNAEPHRAIVRRFWPNQADKIGQVVQTDAGLAISYGTDPMDCGVQFNFTTGLIKVGGQVMLTDLDGQLLPFRIAGLQ